VTIQTKQAVEFGSNVTLYRAVTDDGKQGTLWHRDKNVAIGHFVRRGWK
jgi:hypothetical protein